MDEICRKLSYNNGLFLTVAILKHFTKNNFNQTPTILIATHFNQIFRFKMIEESYTLRFMKMDVQPYENSLNCLYKITQGV